MSYLLQILLPAFLISCALLGDVFWPRPAFISASNLFGKSLMLAAVVAIYAGMDYFLLDYLMLVPGKVYVMA